MALVTGATSGVGAALAATLLRRGWHVVGLGRRPSSIEHAAYHHIALDLSDLSAVRTTIERDVAPMLADTAWRRVALVNNAATPGYLGWLRELDPEDHLRVLAVNVVSPAWLMGFFLRNTPRGTALRIVNVSSGAAVRAVPGLGAYASSKAALRMAGMILGAELDAAHGTARERRDVSVLTYMPGVVDTEMQQLARNRPPGEFPSLRMFEDFHERGIMVPPDVPAKEIADFVESDGQAVYTEASLT